VDLNKKISLQKKAGQLVGERDTTLGTRGMRH